MTQSQICFLKKITPTAVPCGRAQSCIWHELFLQFSKAFWMGEKSFTMLPYFSEIIVFKKGSNKSSRRNVDPNYDFRWIKRSRYGYTRLFLFLNAPILLTKEANPKKLKFVEKPKVSNINFTGIQHQQYRICERLACINGLRTQNFWLWTLQGNNWRLWHFIRCIVILRSPVSQAKWQTETWDL